MPELLEYMTVSNVQACRPGEIDKTNIIITVRGGKTLRCKGIKPGVPVISLIRKTVSLVMAFIKKCVGKLYSSDISLSVFKTSEGKNAPAKRMSYYVQKCW